MIADLLRSPLLGPLVLGAVFGLWMLGAHNRLTALRGTVLSAWVPVEAVMLQRGQALAALLAAAAEPLAAEQAALDAVLTAQAQVVASIDQVRRKPAQHDPVAELSKADAVLAATLPRLLALVEHQAALHADPIVRGALQALAEAKPQLDFARHGFNQAGQAYNAAVAQFPTRLLGSVFRLGRAGTL